MVSAEGIDIEHADILDEDNMAETGNDGRENDRLDTDNVVVQAEHVHPVTPVSYRGEVKSDTGVEEIFN
jgi:hypothetical protein